MAVTEPKLSVGCMSAYLSTQLVPDLPEKAPKVAPGLEPVHSKIKQVSFTCRAEVVTQRLCTYEALQVICCLDPVTARLLYTGAPVPGKAPPD